MKKLFTTMAVLALCSTAAFAQEIDPVDFTLGTDSISSFNNTVTVTVNDTQAAYAIVQLVSGYGFSQNAAEPYPIDLNEDGNTFVVPINESTWGDPFNGTYYLNVMVVLTDNEFETIFDPETEEPVMGMIGYSYSPKEAIFVKSVPNNDWLTTTFDDAYENENNKFKLYFSREVNPTGTIGTIEYFDPDGISYEVITPITVSEYTTEWSDLDGMCIVSFPYANAEFEAEDLGCIKFTFNPFHYEYEDGDVTISGNTVVGDIILSNGAMPAPQQRIVKNKKGLEAGLTVSSVPVNVYSVQGTLLKKNATDLSGLQPGLYIVDGKKVVVK